MSKAMAQEELLPSPQFYAPCLLCVPNNAVNKDSQEQRSFVVSLWPPVMADVLYMKPLGLALMLLLTILSASAGEKLMPSVVELPRPNSSTFSFQQAEARKSEILSNAPTPKLENWKNPFMGFSVHVGEDDSLTVYGHWMKGPPEYSKSRAGQSVADIKKLTHELPLEGNPAGVLITSDVPLNRSKAIRELLKVLFVPSVQLFYAQSSEPDGPAQRSPADWLRDEWNTTDGWLRWLTFTLGYQFKQHARSI